MLKTKNRRRSFISSTSTRQLIASLIEPLEHRTLLSAAPQLLAAPAAASTRPVLTVTAPRNKATEGSRTGYFQITRTGGVIAATLPVSLAITGRAKNGVDYKTTSSSLLFLPGQTTLSIPIAPINDTTLERAEDVNIAIAANSRYDIGTPAKSSVWIYDNDGAVVTIAATTSATTAGSDNPAVFTFTRTGLRSQPVKVSYTIKGTAAYGHDYVGFNNFFIIPAKKTTGTISINAIDDLKPGTDKTVILTLANGWFQAGRIWRSTATIHDSAAPDPNNHDTFPAGTQFVVFRGPGTSTQPGHLFRAVAQGGAVPADISKSLTDLGYTGVDTQINISSNATWMVLHTTRFGGAADTSSLAILKSDDINSGQQIRIGGNVVISTDGPSAVSNDGNTVVYASTDGPHAIDLWAAQFASGQWTSHILTGLDTWTYSNNIQPAISADGTKVLFAAGNAAGDTGTEAIAQVNIDGSAIQTLVTRVNAPADSKADAYLNHPNFTSTPGVIVFGANFTNGADQLWRWATGQTAATPASAATSEVSPAVFSDGRIVSLWRNRDGNAGHVLELTLRDADGSYRGTIAPGVDLPNAGIGVGTWP
ncbi:MAG: hypothetical protein NTU53_21360 [Planctomycetota bacterium]|nr:hypothetical protein [Planctomycetota bacterium]